jgi:predicted DNA-binding transcriptional regulator AlpA
VATKTKTKADPPIVDLAEALMTKRDLCNAMRIGLRTFTDMLGRGEFPKPDRHIGPRQPRWFISTYKAWARSEAS